MADLDYAPYHKYLFPLCKRYDINGGVHEFSEWIVCREGSAGGTAFNSYHNVRPSTGLWADYGTSTMGLVNLQNSSTTIAAERDPNNPNNQTASYDDNGLRLSYRNKDWTRCDAFDSRVVSGDSANNIMITGAIRPYTFSDSLLLYLIPSGGTNQFMRSISAQFTNVGPKHAVAISPWKSGSTGDARVLIGSVDVTDPAYSTPYQVSDIRAEMGCISGYKHYNSRSASYGTRFTHEQAAMWSAGLM